jgi:L-threonylcarbamoyladenylate synthase
VLLDGRDAQAIAQAAQRLAEGELVAFPTETVYGLGARADDDSAVAKIFSAKGRPAEHPLIVHVARAEDALRFTPRMPAPAQRLVETFWPGPLTLIVARTEGVAAAAAGGHATIGLRCPAHPVALSFLSECKRLGVPGVAGPSANLFGRISPTRASHVTAAFDGALTVLDGGDCQAGIESSIVDCSGTRPTLLRPGILARARIESALGQPLLDADSSAPRAPGTLEAHYAPRAKLRVMPAAMLEAALRMLGPTPLKLAVYSRSLPASVAPGVLHRRMPLRPDAAAHELFAALHEFDASQAQLIWVEEPPEGDEWDGVRDRLQRAAAS